MQTVSIFDEVSFKSGTDGITLSCIGGDDIPANEDNIIFKAVREFSKASGININGHFTLKKGIPSQAGLGGGSSDAAAVLKGLNTIYETNFTDSRLYDIAAGIGADVPFFISGGAAICEGIGEIVTPLPSLKDCFIVVAKGDEGISTANAYAQIDKERGDFSENSSFEHDEIIAALIVNDFARVCDYCKNDFDEICGIDDVMKIKGIMRENNALCSILSGSGSAVYGIFEKKKFAQKCASELDDIVSFSTFCTPYNEKFESEAVLY